MKEEEKTHSERSIRQVRETSLVSLLGRAVPAQEDLKEPDEYV